MNIAERIIRSRSKLQGALLLTMGLAVSTGALDWSADTQGLAVAVAGAWMLVIASWSDPNGLAEIDDLVNSRLQSILGPSLAPLVPETKVEAEGTRGDLAAEFGAKDLPSPPPASTVAGGAPISNRRP